MKRKTLFLSLLAALLCMAGCRNESFDGKCTVRIHSTYKDYPVVHLQKPGGAIIDSTLHIDAHDSLVFVRADSTEMPYIAFIRLINPNDAMDWLELPVAIEEGRVDIDLGDVVKLSGTKTNKRLQQFLNERQKLREEVNPSVDDMKAALDEITNAYSAFYAKHILKNADNVLGRFVYKAYGEHLNDADREKVEAKMGKQHAS
jgi:hypothetical protein